MSVDVALLRYYVELVTETGAVYQIDHAVQSLGWEDQEGQLAQKATLSIAADSKVGSKSLRSLLKINCIIRIYASWGSGKKKQFEGTIWEWNFTRSQSRELSIIAYDPMIRLQQSKDFKYFTKGHTTPAIIKNICGDWGVSVSYKWGKKLTHKKKVFNCETISDMIIKLLEEVRQQTGNRYVARYKNGKLEIDEYGQNKDVYEFKGKNTISTSDKLSMNNLVTRVKIIGKADDKGRSSVDAVLDGKLKFGVLQEVIRRDGDKDIGKAKAEAKRTLKERGKPEESIMVTAPDLPFMRKGDAVEMSAGNLSGTFYVLGVSHNADARQMTMTLLRKSDA
ncbi:MAG: hypothetical protein OSJ56_09695 [Prevotella sp.]|nr:hypothetical protein [Prevotella sp.]